MQLTKDQNLVVTTRDKDILVSAAAGSGKTAVLVQRILSKITDASHPIDIDKILIVTFTNAAAAEMRERIHREICDRLDQDRNDENLQRQASLIHNAQITTIDSFCLFLLRNHFHEIELDPCFRVADPNEMKVLEKKALDEVLEGFYQKKDPHFLNLCDAYSPNGKDGQVEELITRLYNRCMAQPWPMTWLNECECDLSDDLEKEIWNKQWMKYLWDLFSVTLQGALGIACSAKAVCDRPDGPYMHAELIESEIEIFKSGIQITQKPFEQKNYEAFSALINGVAFGKLSTKKDESVSPENRERVKVLRNAYKDIIADMKAKYFTDSVAGVIKKEEIANECNLTIIRLTKRYIEILSEMKREKNIIDFSDAEHMALRVLCDEEGNLTKTAMSYRDHYEEVMIDEYQDSNMVQELLLGAIAKTEDGTHNRFMVGDMKQSIYRFRLAKPEIFMEKYHMYKENNPNAVLIGLKQNFRSRREVLDSTNDVFEKVMQDSVGGITYDTDARLYPGANYPLVNESEEDLYKTEMLLFHSEGMKQADYRKAEAKMIAQKIKNMVGKFPVTDLKNEGQVRMASYRDIVILTRAEKKISGLIRAELLAEGIPAHITSKEGYFSSQEVSTLMDFLRVLDNPYNDIALCSVLKSVFFSFDDEMLGLLKVNAKEKSFYDCLRVCAGVLVKAEETENQKDILKSAALHVLETVEAYRKAAVYLNVTQLVNQILMDFCYMEYVTAMPAGQQRKANVEMFVEKTVDFEKTNMHGLFSFIEYMEQLRRYEVDEGEASTLSEVADVVRIMSIHKSKGLEFPICFVACMDKEFNMSEIKPSVLIDADWGIASDYVDLTRRIKGKTLKKNVFAAKIKRDTIGEELRVLYVAMTRAKEKLILTGCTDKYAELLESYQQFFQAGNEIPIHFLSEGKNMLDYILMSYVFHQKNLKIAEVQMSDLEQNEHQALHSDVAARISLTDICRQHEQQLSEAQRQDLEKLKEKFAFIYPYKNLQGLHTKTSVSELKKAAMDEAQLHPQFETQDKETPILPDFMKEKETSGGTDRGSAVHRFLELLDFKKYMAVDEEYLCDSLMQDLNHFVEAGKILPEYASLISIEKIKKFFLSDIAKRMMKAAAEGRLYKEQPFVLSLTADRLNPSFPQEERILIQGIIDVYFEEDNQFVILDYKTDRIQTCEELKARYEIQLAYYEEAVSRITGKTVKEKVLYAFALGKELAWK